MRRASAPTVDNLKAPLFLAALSLAGVFAALAPVADADHCAPYALVDEAVCEANHVVDPWVDFVLCFYNTAPRYWTRYCLVLTAETPLLA